MPNSRLDCQIELRAELDGLNTHAMTGSSLRGRRRG